MTNISTNLMSALLNNESIDEVFRSELENAINSLLATELTAFLNYEKYDYSGRNSGNSRNGFYDRTYFIADYIDFFERDFRKCGDCGNFYK